MLHCDTYCIGYINATITYLKKKARLANYCQAGFGADEGTRTQIGRAHV